MKRTSSQSHGAMSAQQRFAQVPGAEIQRSVFDRSSGLRTAFSSGFLVPVLVEEALPGDTMRLRTHSLVRMTTPYYPLMDNLFLEFFFFAVPVRLLWDNWQKFNGEQVDPGDTTDYTVPQMTETVAEESLSDYMGIPIGVTDLEFNSLHHRAYNLIWNEWFRDENLQDSVVVDKDDGPDTYTDYVMLKRGKRHDYFTSCLPFTQKGDPVLLPLGTSAPVSGTISASGVPTFDYESQTNQKLQATGLTGQNAQFETATGVGGPFDASWNNAGLTLTGATADLSSATAATINQIREAFQVQRLLERDARGGTRYTEIVRSHFGVVSPDQRLQRPEYLGGGSTRVNINPIAVTSFASGGEAGLLGAFALAVGDGMGFLKSFTEHCVVIGMCNVRADLSYQQGLNRMFSRQTRYDFYWPALAHLGEQAVLNKEIYADGSAADDQVFGYQERYAEYRYKPSGTTGRMRSTAATPLDAWHLALDFASLPALNDTFIQDAPPLSRVLAVAGEPEFFGDFWFELQHARPMPTYSVPGLVDHF